MVLMMKQ
ncbi:hypothetical protein AVEN_226079-1, partial [Araneus ventricosus]